MRPKLLLEGAPSIPSALTPLFDAAEIRTRSALILEYVRQEKSEFFTVHGEKMPSALEWVLKVMKRDYPSGDVPYHSRFRHFEVDAASPTPRLPALLERIESLSHSDQRVTLFDLQIISVLLDAGAGKNWRFTDASGVSWSRSEGLAIATFDAFLQGHFSTTAEQPLQVSAARLASFSFQDLTSLFQVTDKNPLAGLEGRLELLRRLGRVCARYEQIFHGRVGGFAAGLPVESPIDARDFLFTLLCALREIWPEERLKIEGLNLGDVWKHPALHIDKSDPTSGYVPFHKLTQWLCYSLIEALEKTGSKVTHVNALTGLPEYRNGGLLLDSGVIAPKDSSFFHRIHRPSDPEIIELRALTIALSDELAELFKNTLGGDYRSWPLANILQAGTWSAGREIAQSLRPDGSPPFMIESDGTIF